ncbi:MAG: hypothetical protein AAF203_01705 [Pseudomonadota bacterium]
MRVFLVFFLAIQVEARCPIGPGEDSKSSCFNEQVFVENALNELKVSALDSYCLQSVDGKQSPGIHCRGPVYYQTNDGQISRDLFEERVVISNLGRTSFLRRYFVKKGNGLYAVYGDRTPDGVLNIDSHSLITGVDIKVSFDKKNRPQFMRRYFRGGQWVRGFFNYQDTHMDLQDFLFGKKTSTSRFSRLNPRQERVWESD